MNKKKEATQLKTGDHVSYCGTTCKVLAITDKQIIIQKVTPFTSNFVMGGTILPGTSTTWKPAGKPLTINKEILL